jgi:hypothetical protein
VQLGEPKLKSQINALEPFKFDIVSEVTLPSVKTPDMHFVDVLEARTSSRHFVPLELGKLSTFLYFSNRVKSTDCNELGQEVTYTNCASPGALNALFVLLRNPDNKQWFVYDPVKHKLGLLKLPAQCSDDVENMCLELLSAASNAWIIWYVADISLLSSKYENPQPLAFRHSGGVSATHALVAQAVGLSYCQLGINGGEQATALSNERQLFGVGLALLGNSPDNGLAIK